MSDQNTVSGFLEAAMKNTNDDTNNWIGQVPMYGVIALLSIASSLEKIAARMENVVPPVAGPTPPKP